MTRWPRTYSMDELRLLTKTGATRLFAFTLALFATFNLLDGGDFFHVASYQIQRNDLPNPLVNTAIYSAAYFLCLAGLVIVYLHRSRAIRWFAFGVTAVTVSTDLGFRQFNGYGFTYHEASLIWAEKEFIGDALTRDIGGYLIPVILSIACVIGFERYGRRHLPVIRSWLLLAIPIAAAPIYQSLLDLTYAKVYQVPMPYRVALLVEHTYRHQLLFYGIRDEPYFEPTDEPVADHILLIVDESVTGDMLHINGAKHQTTPFLDSIPEKILNYGLASAASNLSSTSNIIMQSGLRIDEIPDRELRALKNPNLFSYMKAAGYTTHLIDAQIYSDKPTNLMTGFDLEALDGHLFVRVAEVSAPEYEMDLRALDHAAKIISESKRSFTYLVKSGAHFPYDAKYPPDHTFFQPTLSGDGTGNNLEKTLNSYRNALRWTVDEFIRSLFERYEGKSTSLLVIYTADHGQSLRDSVDDGGPPRSGRPKRWPHAVPIDPPAQQASVPLLLFAFTPGSRAALSERYAPSLKDRASGFEIFPSVLELAGYAPETVRRRYGPSLFDGETPRASRRFVSGNLFGIGGGFYQNTLIRVATFLNEYDLPDADQSE
ncbi:MAG: sulfatase-like hydrolase/transferase [Deltaproteobacteria bacterium]|nr:sulfatase-like hydrolase/transferase [Deltaproteobacteria bacterium]